MVVLNLNKEIAERSQKKFPDYTVELSRSGKTPNAITFRNVIRLSPEDRKAFNLAISGVQDDFGKLINDARVADATDDEELANEIREKIEDFDAVVATREFMIKQLVILATDRTKAAKELSKLKDDEIVIIHDIVINGVAEGELSPSPNS